MGSDFGQGLFLFREIYRLYYERMMKEESQDDSGRD